MENGKQLKPFIKKFTTEKNKYIYDVNTNEFLMVDDAVYDLIDFYHTKDVDIAFSRLDKKYSKEKIRETFELIGKTAEEAGYFSTHRPKEMKFPFDKNEFDMMLKNDLNQIILDVTQECNLRCKYCVLGDAYPDIQNYTSDFMSFNTAKKAVDYFLEHSPRQEFRVIGFYGGEPLLNYKVIHEIVKYVVDEQKIKNVQFYITTNATTLTQSSMEFLIRYNFFVLISLDGPKKVQDRNRVFRNGNGTYNKIIYNLKKFKTLNAVFFGKKVSINPVTSPPYEVEEIQNYFNKSSLFRNNSIKFSSVDRFQSVFFQDYDRDALIKQWKELEQWMQNKFKKWIKTDTKKNGLFIEYYTKRLHIIHRRNIAKLGNIMNPNGQCIIGHRRFNVDPKGNFHICDNMPYSISIGNINKGLDSKKIYSLLKKYSDFSQDYCKNCWAVRMCGTCMKYKFKNGKFNKESTNSACKSIRDRISKDMIFYCSIMEEDEKILDFLHDITYN